MKQRFYNVGKMGVAEIQTEIDNGLVAKKDGPKHRAIVEFGGLNRSSNEPLIRLQIWQLSGYNIEESKAIAALVGHASKLASLGPEISKDLCDKFPNF